MKTLNVNLFAGPNAGKSACAYAICAALQKKGFDAEFVPSVAKECLWTDASYMLDGTYKNQSLLYLRQKERMRQVQGKIDIAVTSSPAIIERAVKPPASAVWR